MSYNFHNHKQRGVVTEEKPVSVSHFVPLKWNFINYDFGALELLDRQPTLVPRETKELARDVEHALIEGRAKIEHGWVKGMWQGMVAGREVFCARGAVALGGGKANRDAEAYLLRALPLNYRTFADMYGCGTDAGGVIAYFNDDAGTTHQDVLGLFDRAITIAHLDAA